MAGTIVKNFHEANEKLKEETKKIWSLAQHMTEKEFIKKIYFEEKVYNDGTTTPDKWFQFKEEIIYIHGRYNMLLPILNNAQFLEVEAMKEANSFINDLYEMVMTLDFRLKEQPENRAILLQNALENIRIICTEMYCTMAMNELERNVKLMQKKNKKIKTKAITNLKGKTWIVAEDKKEDCENLLNTKEKYSQKASGANQIVISSVEEKSYFKNKIEEEILNHRINMIDGGVTINSFEDWENLTRFVKVNKQDYEWIIQGNIGTNEDSCKKYLDLLEQCLDICNYKYKSKIPESDIPKLGDYIKVICIAQHIAEVKNTINSISEKGRKNTVIENIERELDEKQESIYKNYEEAMNFMNGELEETENHTI